MAAAAAAAAERSRTSRSRPSSRGFAVSGCVLLWLLVPAAVLAFPRALRGGDAGLLPCPLRARHRVDEWESQIPSPPVPFCIEFYLRPRPLDWPSPCKPLLQTVNCCPVVAGCQLPSLSPPSPIHRSSPFSSVPSLHSSSRADAVACC